MITNVRSALIVDEVKQDPVHGVCLLGVKGDDLKIGFRPGLIFVWLAMVFDTDGRPTRGNVFVRAADYSNSAPIDIPAGHASASWNMQMGLPIMSEGALNVTVRDSNLRAKPFKLTWHLGFTEDAVPAPADVLAALMEYTDSGKAAAAAKSGSVN